MMKNILKVLAILCAVMMVISLAACGGSDKGADTDTAVTEDTANAGEAIVGSWAYSDTYIYTFNSDGTGTYDVGGTIMNFTYEANDNELSILYDGNTAPMVLEYSIDGDTLNVKDSFGEDTLYTRK